MIIIINPSYNISAQIVWATKHIGDKTNRRQNVSAAKHIGDQSKKLINSLQLAKAILILYQHANKPF
jgi:hypothetical protein